MAFGTCSGVLCRDNMADGTDLGCGTTKTRIHLQLLHCLPAYLRKLLSLSEPWVLLIC